MRNQKLQVRHNLVFVLSPPVSVCLPHSPSEAVLQLETVEDSYSHVRSDPRHAQICLVRPAKALI